MPWGEEARLQNFLADLRIFMKNKQLTLIEGGKKEVENRLSWQIFARAFYLLKKKGTRHVFHLRGNIKDKSWCFWWTERYEIGFDFIFRLSLETTKYKNVPEKIKKLPKKIGDKDFKTILLGLIGETETLDKGKLIILTEISTHFYKIIDHKLVKIPLNNKQKRNLLLVLSFIRQKIKAKEGLIDLILNKGGII
ncbi:hypothetical protein FJZ41_00855 [Candidatus Shapirobacteria bacterium]|nr:hypothetical protein [Candidatus Shapirobacteria bacterium]